MILSQPRETVEECVLVDLIRQPKTHSWELSGITPDLFADPNHRTVAEALCWLRDGGRKLTSRSAVRLLRVVLKRKGLTKYVTLLARNGLSTHGSMTVYVSQLHWYAARSRRRVA